MQHLRAAEIHIPVRLTISTCGPAGKALIPVTGVHKRFRFPFPSCGRHGPRPTGRFSPWITKDGYDAKYAAIAVALSLVFATVSARAMPCPASTADGKPMIFKAAYWCGDGWTRGPPRALPRPLHPPARMAHRAARMALLPELNATGLRLSKRRAVADRPFHVRPAQSILFHVFEKCVIVSSP